MGMHEQSSWVKPFIAGLVAGGVEGTITYPTEYVKTRLQLSSQEGNKPKGALDCLRRTIKTKGVFAIYEGLAPLAIGTSLKAGVRFFSYENYKRSLSKLLGEKSPITSFTGKRAKLFLSNQKAGLLAGITEGVIVVTPSETIKTKIIENSVRIPRKFDNAFQGNRKSTRSNIKGVKIIAKEEGFKGLYQGVSAVVARQAANSAIRFTVYDFFKTQTARIVPSNKWYVDFVNGAATGAITVFLTMPIDVVKTRLQSLDALKTYSGMTQCFMSIVKNEGLLTLWKGMSPRLCRLLASGGITFTTYEQVMKLLTFTSRV